MRTIQQLVHQRPSAQRQQEREQEREQERPLQQKMAHDGGRRLFMPRYAQPEELTPFAQLLTDYMWNRRPANRPPMSTSQLAAKLGVPKQSVSNWIMRGSVPPLETILVIMARLDIPMRALYDSYRNAGLTVPRWIEDDAEAPTDVHPALPETPRARRQTKTPSESYTESHRDDEVPQAPAPRPYVPPERVSDEEMSERQWQRLIAQTTTTLKEAGAPESMIAEMIAHIRRRQADTPEPMAAHIIAEHSPSSSEAGFDGGADGGAEASTKSSEPQPSETQASQSPSTPPSTSPSKSPSSKSPAGR